MHNGFFRVAACVPSVSVGDVAANTSSIISMIQTLERKSVELAVFPELCVTGYTCGDLFHNEALLDAASEAVQRIAAATSASAAYEPTPPTPKTATRAPANLSMASLPSKIRVREN